MCEKIKLFQSQRRNSPFFNGEFADKNIRFPFIQSLFILLTYFQKSMSYYYQSRFHRQQEIGRHEELSQSPRFSPTFEIRKPQPSHQCKITKPEQVQTNSNNSNQVLRSNDIFASFGQKNQQNPLSNQKNKFNVKAQTRSCNSDLELTKKVSVSQKVPENEAIDKTQNVRAKQNGAGLKQEKRLQDLGRTENFYSFLYKLLGFISSHLRIKGSEFFRQLENNSQAKLAKTRYLSIAIRKIQIKRLFEGYQLLKQNLMQNSVVVRVDQDNEASEKKSYTKIDMLAEENIDIDFSEGYKESHMRDISGKEFESQKQTKSDIQLTNNGFTEEENKLKMFHFNNHIKRKNTNTFSNYGFGLDQLIRNKQLIKKKKQITSQLSIFSKVDLKDTPFQNLQLKKIQANNTSSLKIELQEKPFLHRFSKAQNKSNRKVCEQRVDHLEEQLPDISDLSLESLQKDSFFENIKVSFDNRDSMDKKLSQLKKIVKNVDSLIENKVSFEQEKKESYNFRKSADSFKYSDFRLSEKFSERVSQNEKNSIKRENFENAEIKPVEQYQTQKDLLQQKEQYKSKYVSERQILHRPKSMTVVKINPQSPKIEKAIQPSQQNQYIQKSYIRPTSNIVSPNKNPVHVNIHQPNQEIRRGQLIKKETFSSQPFQTRVRANSGMPSYTYHSPSYARNEKILQSPTKEPIRVYFANSPSKQINFVNKHQIPQKRILSPPKHNFYGLQSRVERKITNNQPYVHRYQRDPNVATSPYSGSQQKIQYHPIQQVRKINTQKVQQFGRSALQEGTQRKQAKEQKVRESPIMRKKSVSTQKIRIVSAINRKQ